LPIDNEIALLLTRASIAHRRGTANSVDIAPPSSVVRVLVLAVVWWGRPVGALPGVAALLVVATGVTLDVLGGNLDDFPLGGSLEHAEHHVLVIMTVTVLMTMFVTALVRGWRSVAGDVDRGLLGESELVRLTPAFT